MRTSTGISGLCVTGGYGRARLGTSPRGVTPTAPPPDDPPPGDPFLALLTANDVAYDMTDASTLWADTSLTTPASEDGAVKGISDVRGRLASRDMTGASVAAVRRAGHLELSAGNTSCFSSATRPGVNGDITVVASFRFDASTGTHQSVVAADASAGLRALAMLRHSSHTTLFMRGYDVYGAPAAWFGVATIPYGSDRVGTSIRGRDGVQQTRVGTALGSAVDTSNGGLKPPYAGAFKMFIGAGANGGATPTSWPMRGRIYAVAWFERVLNSDDLAAAEAWAASKIPVLS